MIKLLTLSTILISLSSPTQAKVDCSFGESRTLVARWSEFKNASLHDEPVKIANFYQFPLKLLPAYDDEKPIIVSKKFFIKYYPFIFKKNYWGNEVDLFTKLKAESANKKELSANYFTANGCIKSNSNRIDNYNFILTKYKSWQIESVYYTNNQELLSLIKDDKKYIITKDENGEVTLEKKSLPN